MWLAGFIKIHLFNMVITSDVAVLLIQIACFSFQEGSTYIGTSDAVTSQDIGQSNILVFIITFSRF